VWISPLSHRDRQSVTFKKHKTFTFHWDVSSNHHNCYGDRWDPYHYCTTNVFGSH